MKIFISQPMRGKTQEEIAAERTNAIKDLQREYPDAEILDTHFTDYDGRAVHFLGKAILKLGEADLAIFLPGWDSARGCLNEQRICQDYGIQCLYPKK